MDLALVSRTMIDVSPYKLTKQTLFALALICSSAAVARGETAAQAEGDLNGDGRPETVAIAATEGELTLIIDGQEIAESTSRGPGLGEAAAELRVVPLGSGRVGAIYSAPLEREGLAYEAILFARRNSAPTVVWSGITGLRGDRGSRWGDRIIVEDLTGDGVPNILIAAVADEVPLCGVDAPELFPRALDPASGRLRPVQLNRLRNVEVEPIELEATTNNPGTLSETPALEVASFAIASTVVGDRGAVEGLSAPRALSDGNPATVWIEGRPGNGAGEFVSARLLPGPYRVHALSLVLAPATVEGEEPRELGRPRTLTLLTDGADGLGRFLVTIPSDPNDRPGEPLWIRFPEPRNVSCLSVVLGEVFGGRNAPSATAIAEVDLFTDLDFEGGAEHVIAALAEGAADVEVMLRALGDGAAPLLAEHWSELDDNARRRALRVLVMLEDPAGAPLLVDAALGDDERAREEARRGLNALGETAIGPLLRELGSDDDDRRHRTAELLGELGTPSAIEGLVARIADEGGVEQGDLPSLRRALHVALEEAENAPRTTVLERAATLSGPPQQALLTALVPLRAAERERHAQLIVASWESASDFDSRYRLLTAAGGSGAVEGLLSLITTVLATDEDRYLRVRAAEVLGMLGENGADVTAALAAAADDDWTGVRLAVASSLGTTEGSAALGALNELLQDRWPVIRVEAARALLRSQESQALTPLVTALSDHSAMVQINAARLLGELGSPEALTPLITLARAEDEAVESRQAAARALGALCSAPAQAALLELIREALEARNDRPRVEVATAAAAALARFSNETVGRLLIDASNRGAPPLRVAAIEALGQGGHPGAEEALQALTEAQLPPLRAAAATALRQLESHRGLDRATCPER